MKKERIIEAVYIIAALAFIGICISGRQEPVKEVLGNEIVPTPVADSTKAPEKPGEKIPEISPEDNQNVTLPPVQEVTPPPTQEVTPSPDESDTPVEDELPPEVQEEIREDLQEKEPADEKREQGKMPGAIEIVNENYTEYDNTEYSWWFRRKEDHVPSGSGEEFSIEPYSSYYIDKNVSEDDKVIYLTFDCGYENGFTPSILDTLKEKNVKALFFVAQHFVESRPEYVKRMKDEGHMVGNHTVRHLSSPELTPEELVTELETVASTMEQMTGYSMDPYFRPPMGRYSERTLKVAQDMGYVSLFWSIAYYDYDRNDQPGKEYVVDHFDTYHHNGSVILMHNISESNAEALGDVIDLLRSEGYRFGEVSEFTEIR